MLYDAPETNLLIMKAQEALYRMETRGTNPLPFFKNPESRETVNSGPSHTLVKGFMIRTGPFKQNRKV